MIAQMSFFFETCFSFSDPLGCQQGASKLTVECSRANVFQMGGDLKLEDIALKETQPDTSSISPETRDSPTL